MFESRLLDFFSRVHPAVPPLLFVPAIALMAAWGLAQVSVAAMVGLAVAGYALWTLFEYWLHRVVFHFEPEQGVGARLHWIIHGIHHEHPNDPMRLVMPPAVSVPLAAIVFGVLYLIFGERYAPGLAVGFFTGYVVYDMLHYYLHHFAPRGRRGADAARAPHAPPLPGRHARLRDQRPLLGRGVPHLPAQPPGRGRAVAGWIKGPRAA